jgi:hypothetical protein
LNERKETGDYCLRSIFGDSRIKKIEKFRAGELLDVDNILTSPDLLNEVGLSSWRQGIITLAQTGKEVQHDKMITVGGIVNIDYINSFLF